MCFEIFFAECQKKHSAKKLFAECQKKHSAKSLFAECQKKTLGKGVFAECPKNNTRQTTWHSAKSRSPVVIELTLNVLLYKKICGGIHFSTTMKMWVNEKGSNTKCKNGYGSF